MSNECEKERELESFMNLNIEINRRRYKGACFGEGERICCLPMYLFQDRGQVSNTNLLIY
jgi:hypothetical protein